MSAAKSVTGLLIFAKLESTPNAGAIMSASDVVQTVLAHPVFNLQYSYDGNRNGASYSGGSYSRAAPSGRTTSATVRVEAKGLGSAYSLTATPPNLHALLLASGLSGSLQASTWVYKPVPLTTQETSVALAVYGKTGPTAVEVWPVSGTYANLKMNGDNPGPVIFDFDLQGSVGMPSDISSAPARTWTASGTLPPNTTNVGFTIGSYSGSVVRSWKYDHGLEVAPRVDINATNGHAGFSIGRRSPKLTVTIETPLLSAYNPYSDFDLATSRAVSLTVGSVANNRFVLSMPNSQLANVVGGNDGPVATLELTFQPSVTAADASDDLTLTFN
jgi:hypothetical protein